MEYSEFFLRFMGSCRTKHLVKERELVDLIKESFTRDKNKPPINPLKGNRYRVPEKSELDPEFIRMEPWEVEYLFFMASTSRSGILETGRAHGGSTFAIACANSGVPVRSIDIAPVDDSKLEQLFLKTGVGKNVEIIIGNSQEGIYNEINDLDLLFIDGDHSFHGCLRDLQQWYPRVLPGGHVLLHDCYAGSPVQHAVIEFLSRHPAEVVQSPYISASHWRYPAGSLVHFRKPKAPSAS